MTMADAARTPDSVASASTGEMEDENMTTFYDIESGEIITSATLYREYLANKAAAPDEFRYSFLDYIKNCLTAHNGTLERME